MDALASLRDPVHNHLVDVATAPVEGAPGEPFTLTVAG